MSLFTNPASGAAEQGVAYTKAIVELLGSLDPVEVLRATPHELARAVRGISDDALSTPEAPGKWSIAQALRHLADAELVWGYRLRMVIAEDRPALAGFDQDAWAERLAYADANPFESLVEFTAMRQGNLRLLDGTAPEALGRVGVHAERGEESVEHMLSMAAGHDLAHLRQVERIRRAVEGPGLRTTS